MSIVHRITEKANDFRNYSSDLPKYIALRDFLKNEIEKSTALGGSKLPSSRKLASILGISRSSVNKAYELLVFEGIVEAKKGSGHVIIDKKGTAIDIAQHIRTDVHYPRISDSGNNFLMNEHIMYTGNDSSIAFRPGLPPLDVFPVHQWMKLLNLYWRNIKASSLNYSNVSGLKALKQQIAEYLYFMRGVVCDPEQVIIVSGSVQSLFLIGSSLINPGDTVVMENPTFPNVHSIFKSLSADLQALPLDQEGIDLRQLPPGLMPKIIHLTPSNHYPTGRKMSLQRKLEILKWAKEKGTIVIENDYDHEISNWGLKDPSLYELDPDNRTVYLGTFNRLLHPSIRLGYMVVPYYLLDVVKAFQKHSHRFVSPSNQVIMSEFIRKSYLLNHIKNVIAVNAERAEVFKAYLAEHIDASFTLVASEANSLHTLCKFAGPYTDSEVIKALSERQIVAHRYSQCFITGPEEQGLIFGHAAVNKHLMNPMLKKTVQVYNQQFARKMP